MQLNAKMFKGVASKAKMERKKMRAEAQGEKNENDTSCHPVFFGIKGLFHNDRKQ